MIRVASHEPWKPDIVLYNNAKGKDNQHFGESNLMVHYNGDVLWPPTGEFYSYCDLKENTVLQKCSLFMGSWTYDVYNLNTTLKNPAVGTEFYYNNPEWEVLDVSASREENYFPCCTEPYVSITYTFTILKK